MFNKGGSWSLSAAELGWVGGGGCWAQCAGVDTALDWVTFVLGTGPSSAINSCVALAR